MVSFNNMTKVVDVVSFHNLSKVLDVLSFNNLSKVVDVLSFNDLLKFVNVLSFNDLLKVVHRRGALLMIFNSTSVNALSNGKEGSALKHQFCFKSATDFLLLLVYISHTDW